MNRARATPSARYEAEHFKRCPLCGACAIGFGLKDISNRCRSLRAIGRSGSAFDALHTHNFAKRQLAAALATLDVMFDSSKDSHFREQHWSAIFGGIDKHLDGEPPFRRVTLRL
jgi:hypothetical protein